ncbi:hypothetical protein A0H81_02776 [Grifola frondosa]|uniref:Uncharacterized protein n=1 Tax=Grifola frondosa TaxID=5627 RepID=A0A1C7MMN4_GRIFR|nr:hypothetical protein A0H81_02776 [Grifola frondosa]
MDNLAEAEKLHGFSKLRKCCEKVLQEDFDWVWIDTCCIDKTSSSELSEAINSMFSWYHMSEVCYAYLDDVEESSTSSVEEKFRRSEWFRRGWTLQELIAPNQVVFFAEDWSEIGTRKSLVDEINDITRIDRDVLLGFKLPVEFCVSQRMLWASRRETTRVEDMAYCLMGLFDVHMPTIYGEGNQAFIRLQHEVMRSTTDHSIFAWDGRGIVYDMQMDVLAPEPNVFQGFRATPYIIRPIPFKDFARRFGMDSYSPEYTATNHGIRIRLPIKESTLRNGEHGYTAALACYIGDQILLGLRLWRVEGTTDQYYRVGHLIEITDLDPKSFTIKDLYLAYRSRSRALRGRLGVSIMLLPVDTPCRYSPRRLHPCRRWAVGTRE